MAAGAKAAPSPAAAPPSRPSCNQNDKAFDRLPPEAPPPSHTTPPKPIRPGT
jgi:hypothetical protein